MLRSNMDFKSVAIIGVGLMGSSFALAIKKTGFSGKITGIGRKEANLIKARDLGIIDEYSTVPVKGIEDADLILLATPVGQFENILKDIRHQIKEGTIVTDVGSVKEEVVKRLEPMMPVGSGFVGGHPIAGNERSGINAATAELYKGARCIITSTRNTDKSSLDKVVKLWNALGSKVTIMTPEEHDTVFAAVSHLPHVVAYVLINTIMDLREDILQYGGNGLKDMTRIASSPAELWRDICSYNKDTVLQSLKSFSSSVSKTIELIERSDWTGLEKEFLKANKGRKLLESD
jgi:prephenate dehydrogenase